MRMIIALAVLIFSGAAYAGTGDFVRARLVRGGVGSGTAGLSGAGERE